MGGVRADRKRFRRDEKRTHQQGWAGRTLAERSTVHLGSEAGVDLIVCLAGRSKVASHSLDNNRGGFLGIPPKVLGLTPLLPVLPPGPSPQPNRVNAHGYEPGRAKRCPGLRLVGDGEFDGGGGGDFGAGQGGLVNDDGVWPLGRRHVIHFAAQLRHVQTVLRVIFIQAD